MVGELGESPHRHAGDRSSNDEIGAERRVERVRVPPNCAQQAVQYIGAEMQPRPIGSSSLATRRVCHAECKMAAAGATAYRDNGAGLSGPVTLPVGFVGFVRLDYAPSHDVLLHDHRALRAKSTLIVAHLFQLCLTGFLLALESL